MEIIPAVESLKYKFTFRVTLRLIVSESGIEPIKLAYVRAYATNMAYVTPPGHNESAKYFRRRLYTTLRTMALAASTNREIRVITMRPNLKWPQIWQNLHMAWVPDHEKSAWFLAIRT